jgi:hypothetical protein
MFRKVLLLAAALAIVTSVGTSAHAGLSLDPRASDAYASADTSGKTAQLSAPVTDAAPAKPAKAAATTSTTPVSTAPTFRRTAAPKQVAVNVIGLGYNRGYSTVHGVTY